MKRFVIIETFFGNKPQNFYALTLPNVRDDGFYRQTVSFNAFFHSIRNPKANVTEVRQFTANYPDEIDIHKKFRTDVDWDNLKTFNTIWEFYEFIGYNYKTRRYKSGEVQKVWSEKEYTFVVPKKKAISRLARS